jgi:hypothetical protein
MKGSYYYRENTIYEGLVGIDKKWNSDVKCIPFNNVFISLSDRLSKTCLVLTASE